MIIIDHNISFDNISVIPNIEIKHRPTDKYIMYDPNIDRLDILAHKLYNNPKLWKILYYANKEVLQYNEYNIEQKIKIRIPNPIGEVLEEIQYQIIKYTQHDT